MNLRPYQQRALDELWAWFARHDDGNPIVEAAVGAGKSLMMAAVAQRANAEYPGTRVLTLCHQKELLEQNVDKLVRVWPEADVGLISAAVGRRQLGRQITYATIGSVYKIAHELGQVDIVNADECHLINPREIGMWRQFLGDLQRYCPHTRVIGWTGTPFRGNGVWLTAEDSALFTHVATRVTMRELLDAGFLSPLTAARTETRVTADGVRTSGDDYVVSELAKITDREPLVEATASEICALFSDRRRWLVFAVTIEHAEHVRDALRRRGVAAESVSADTPKAERERLIAAFRAGRIRCLVNVAVLTTGFDAPEIDAIALLRATKSPVLYVQMAGRGMRLADGKADCLFADFTDTVARLGPVDEIKGRMPKPKGASEAPFKLCPECGTRNLAAAVTCIDCGFKFPEPERIKHTDQASGAAVLSTEMQGPRPHEVTAVEYYLHQKFGSPDTLRCEYYSGIAVVAREWACFDHQGMPRRKAELWWQRRAKGGAGVPSSTAEALQRAKAGELREPDKIWLDRSSKYPEVVSVNFPQQEAATA